MAELETLVPEAATSRVVLAPPGASGDRPPGNALALLRAWLGPLAGRALLDVGCGPGRLARVLSEDGARVTGIDPQEEVIAQARAEAAAARFEVAGAAALPFADRSFDAVIFLNSLHHVPVAEMDQAFAEAARVSRGPIVVVEPLPEGPFFETVRPVEDETAVRAAAQRAIDTALGSGVVRLRDSGEYDDTRRFPDLDAFLAMVVVVDPARVPVVARVRGEVAERFVRLGVREGDKTRLVQPHRAHFLEVADA